MARYIFRRVFQSVVLLFIVLTVVFFAGRMIGDPAILILGTQADAETILQLRTNLGLEEPLLMQYARFLFGLVQGDLGDTFRFGMSKGELGAGLPEGRAALPLVLERLPATFYLAGVAVVMAISVAIPIGILAAMHPRSLFDRVVNIVSLAGVSVVEFWLALMLVLIFSVALGWLPTSGYGGIGFVILPAMALAFRSIGRIAQITRSSMLDELAKPYIITARAKGLSPVRVSLVHALKNASIPILTITGDEIATILTGVIIIEFIFSWPGIGQITLDALARRDLPIVQASIFVLVLIVLVINLLVDIAYIFLNPSVRMR